MKTFRGSYTVMLTPFTEDGSAVDEKALRRFVDWQIDNGVPGLIALGSTGEFLSVTEDERTQIISAVVEQTAGRIPVLAGTMNAHTPTAVKYSKEAEALGADGLMIISPYYYTPTEDEIFAYYAAISEAVSIPIMLYNNPFASKVDLSPELVARMTKSFENIRYIKESSGDLTRVQTIRELTDDVMTVFASIFYEGFLLGSKGWVSPQGNYLPRQSADFFNLMFEGRMADAHRLAKIFQAIDSIQAEGHPMYGHQDYGKVLCRMVGQPIGEVRAPHMPIRKLGEEGKEKLARLQKLLEDAGALITEKAA